jgi:hypothetical protein
MRLVCFDYDYATLNSYDRELLYVARDIALRATKGYTSGGKSRQGGYSGAKIDGMFFGSRMQFKAGQGFEHHNVRLWGDQTHDRMLVFSDYLSDLNATRIDVQATFATDCAEPLRETYLALKEIGMNCKFVETNTETVYIGSRTSQRYIRVYEKTGKDAYPYLTGAERLEGFRVIRFEVEFKDVLAKEAWERLDTSKKPLLPILSAELGQKHVDTAISHGMLKAMTEALQGEPSFHLKGKRKETDPYVFFTDTILPWLLKRKEKLEGSELENVEQWCQSGFNLEDDIPF